MNDPKIYWDKNESDNDVRCVAKADYDALAAELAELRRHLGTLTPGGSHTCITCAAHCVVIGDLEAQVESLQNRWATRPLSGEDQGRRIAALEAELESYREAEREASTLQGYARE